jgi:ribosomal protein L7/L12
MAVASAGSAQAAVRRTKEEPTVFNVVLTEAGANRIGVKAVRELVTLGLQAKAREALERINASTRQRQKRQRKNSRQQVQKLSSSKIVDCRS